MLRNSFWLRVIRNSGVGFVRHRDLHHVLHAEELAFKVHSSLRIKVAKVRTLIRDSNFGYGWLILLLNIVNGAKFSGWVELGGSRSVLVILHRY